MHVFIKPMNHKNKHLIQLQKDFGPIVLKFGLSEKIAKCAQSQSSSCFVHLFSKRPNHEEDFFKVRTSRSEKKEPRPSK